MCASFFVETFFMSRLLSINCRDTQNPLTLLAKLRRLTL